MINETDYTNNSLTKEHELKIDEIFAQYDTTDKPGCSVGVIQDGKFIYKKSFGMANLDNDIPINSKSKFNIGSIAKEFTASCIALLAMEGKLNLDDKVRKYISELPDYGKSITIRHLLYHTSGLRDYNNLLFFAGFDFERSYSHEECKKILFRQKGLDFEPGESNTYSNSGYLLLAEIVNIVSGKSLKEYSKERIFKPLGMNDTFFVGKINEVIKNKVTAYKVNNSEISNITHILEPIGAGGIYSTIDDFLKWDSNFNKPKVGGIEFLELIQRKGYLNNNEVLAYGMGFRHGTYNCLKWIGHGGAGFGFRSFYMRFPEYKTSIIIMANCENAEEYSKSTQITDILYKTTSSIAKPALVENKFIELSLTELERFCGSYVEEESKLKREIYIENGNLFYSRESDDRSKLIPIDKNSLTLELNPSDVKLIFEFEENFKKFKFLINNQCASTFFSYAQKIFEKNYLCRFVGKYNCDELDVVYDIKLESEKLVLYINGIKMSDIKGIAPDFFDITEWSSLIHFLYDDKNIVSGFLFHNERAKRLEFVKID